MAAVTVVLGPMPCKSCRALVVFTDVGGERVLMTKRSMRRHECEPIPSDWSWSWLVATYGEDEALIQLSNVGPWPSLRRIERERTRKRLAARKRAARVAA